jgi:hypothetical protein
MSSRVAIRVLGAGLGLMFLVGSARAGDGFTNFSECESPLAVPESFFGTVITQGNAAFGDLSVKVCNGITKKADATCKAQVKSAAKCNDKSNDSLYDMVLKQCAQLSIPADRDVCKTDAKNNRDAIKAANKANKDSALTECDAEFDAAIQNACVNGVPM